MNESPQIHIWVQDFFRVSQDLWSNTLGLQALSLRYCCWLFSFKPTFVFSLVGESWVRMIFSGTTDEVTKPHSSGCSADQMAQWALVQLLSWLKLAASRFHGGQASVLLYSKVWAGNVGSTSLAQCKPPLFDIRTPEAGNVLGFFQESWHFHILTWCQELLTLWKKNQTKTNTPRLMWTDSSPFVPPKMPLNILLPPCLEDKRHVVLMDPFFGQCATSRFDGTGDCSL